MTVTAGTPLRVVRHDDGVDRWEMVYGQPHPRLRRYVLRYCGYDEHTTSFTRRLEAAGVEVPLIINLGPPLGIRLSTDAGFTDHREGFLGGLHGGYTVVDSCGSQRGLEISLTPVGAQRLLGVSMREVTSRLVPLGDAFGVLAAELREQIIEGTDWRTRFAVAERFLIARFERSPEPPAALRWALDRMHLTHGTVDIASLTEELGCSRRYLIGLFNDHVGVPPKLFARLLRFQQASAFSESGQHGWSEVAARFGYYDQAHLIRAFHQFAGRTPVSFAASSLGDGGVRAE